MASTTFPRFSLTEEETQQTKRILSRHLSSCCAILNSVQLISPTDYAEALRYVREALLEAENFDESESEPLEAALTACFVYKGDCLAGLSKFVEAQQAYEEALTHYSPAAGGDEKDMDSASICSKIRQTKRRACVWSEDDLARRESKILGLGDEHWDFEPGKCRGICTQVLCKLELQPCNFS